MFNIGTMSHESLMWMGIIIWLGFVVVAGISWLTSKNTASLPSGNSANVAPGLGVWG
jgi:hypothetical protein